MESIPTVSRVFMESMFKRALAPRITPRVQEQLKALGVNLEAPLHAAYSQEVYSRAMALVAEQCFPGLPSEAAFREMGRLYIQGYGQSQLGAAFMEMARAVGPERTLQRMQHNQRSNNNYTQLEWVKQDERHFIIHSSIVPEMAPRFVVVPGFHPGPFTSGVYQEVLNLLGVRNPTVEYRVVDPVLMKFTFVLTWDAPAP